MSKSVRLDEEAVEELDAAALWYEARRRRLGLDFVVAVRDAFQKIAINPLAWPVVRDVPERFGARHFLLRRFPYAIVFIELDEEIRVVAIAHTSREPGFWRGRM